MTTRATCRGAGPRASLPKPTRVSSWWYSNVLSADMCGEDETLAGRGNHGRCYIEKVRQLTRPGAGVCLAAKTVRQFQARAANQHATREVGPLAVETVHVRRYHERGEHGGDSPTQENNMATQEQDFNKETNRQFTRLFIKDSQGITIDLTEVQCRAGVAIPADAP